MATPIKAQEAIAPAINLKPKTKISLRLKVYSDNLVHQILVESSSEPNNLI